MNGLFQLCAAVLFVLWDRGRMLRGAWRRREWRNARIAWPLVQPLPGRGAGGACRGRLAGFDPQPHIVGDAALTDTSH